MTELNKKEVFKELVEISIRREIQKVLERTGKDSLTYIDACSITNYVRAIFLQSLDTVTPSVEKACNQSEAILAPDTVTRRDKIKKTKGLMFGYAGLAMILGGVGTAMGWGASFMHTITVFFTGTRIAGPIGWILGGIVLGTIAYCMTFAGDGPEHTEHFRKELIESINQAIDIIWDEYEEKLSRVAEEVKHARNNEIRRATI